MVKNTVVLRVSRRDKMRYETARSNVHQKTTLVNRIALQRLAHVSKMESKRLPVKMMHCSIIGIRNQKTIKQMGGKHKWRQEHKQNTFWVNQRLLFTPSGDVVTTSISAPSLFSWWWKREKRDGDNDVATVVTSANKVAFCSIKSQKMYLTTNLKVKATGVGHVSGEVRQLIQLTQTIMAKFHLASLLANN